MLLYTKFLHQCLSSSSKLLLHLYVITISDHLTGLTAERDCIISCCQVARQQSRWVVRWIGCILLTNFAQQSLILSGLIAEIMKAETFVMNTSSQLSLSGVCQCLLILGMLCMLCKLQCLSICVLETVVRTTSTLTQAHRVIRRSSSQSIEPKIK